MQNTKQLNTMESFRNGFKIEREGKIYTLTAEEMSDFRYLDKAITGQDCIEIVRERYDKQLDNYEVLSAMMQDEEICFNVEDDILDTAFVDCGYIETVVIEEYIRRNKSDILQQLQKKGN